jgi:single-stranded-DNA-specific exonuclease
MKAIERFRDNGVKLIITIDLGTSNVEEIAQAEAFGIDVIVTDHHLPRLISAEKNGGQAKTDLPHAYAIVNPKLSPDYNDVMLCGSGVVFRLVQAFLAKYREYYKVQDGWEKWLLDMAGLATLSDMVPLVKENRVLAYYGMMVLKKSPRPGLLRLLYKMKVDPRTMTEDDIAFMLTPRINAASRMDNPLRAFELLSTRDILKAGTLADHLTSINDERKTLVATIMKEAHHTLREREEKHVIVIGNPKWRVGVLGLVASKIMEEYKKPTFVWGLEGASVIKGSCRSDGSVNLVSLMAHIPKDSLLEFGGHELAGGFSVSHESVHFLEEHLSASYTEIKKEGAIVSANPIDMHLTLDDVTMKNYKDIAKLAPFGVGNPKPTFLFEHVMIQNVKEFGKEQNHLELCFENSNGRPIKAIAFFKTRASYGRALQKGVSINLVATFELSNFAGREELRLRIVDIL